MPSGRKYNGTPSLRITDFSDRELLAIARDLSDSDGVVDIEYVALHIWPRGKRDADWLWHSRRCVSIRFAHMRKLGVVDKIKETGLWEITDLGEDYVAGKIKSLKLMSQAGDMFEEVSDDQANLMRREFLFRIANRKRFG